MSDYPNGVYSPRTKANKLGVVYDETKSTQLFAEDITKLDDEVVAIETELGENPKGIYATVAANLVALWSAISSFATSFLELTDAPSSYTDQAGKVVAVNAEEDGLEFIVAGGGGECTCDALKFGNGADGDVVISSNTSLTADMFYNNLTINNGIILNPNGFRVFVKDTLNCIGTGKIACNGNNGGNGGNGNGNNGGSAGSAGAVVYSSGTLPVPLAGSNGGVGVNRGGSGGSVGVNGANTAKGIGVNGTNGGNGGTSTQIGHTPGKAGGTAGIKTGTILDYPKTYTTAINLFDKNGTAIAQHTISAGSGGGGGGGGQEACDGGGGGGSGSTGGMVWIAAKNIININIEAKGGNGGNGGNSYSDGGYYRAGVGGGGAGGSGGVIILIYSILTASSLSVAGGTKGSYGTLGYNNGCVAAEDGNTGTIIQLQI